MLERIVGTVVGWSERRALLLVILSLLLTGAAGLFTARHLGMDTDTANMISPDLPWRKDLAHFNDLFPQNTGLLVVMIDGKTPDAAEDAAAALFARIAARKDLFATARRADGGPFFEKYGLLFLPTDQVRKIADAVIEAQPFIGSLMQDPTLRGLFGTLSFFAEHVAEQPGSIGRLEKPLASISTALSDALSGKRQAMSWQTVLFDRPTEARELRRLILTQPNRDFAALKPGEAATGFVRDSVKELGLTPDTGVTVRLTGPVALNDDEFATVAEGMGWALIISTVLVLLWLFMALRSIKLILATFITLVIGLVLTFAFATLAVGKLNLISVAFAVMFIGLSIDFGIQFGVRYGQEKIEGGFVGALTRTGIAMARPLTLAAIAIAVGFAAFIPTDYRGVSELGLIATAGMAVTLALNLTLLPALLALFKPRFLAAEMGLAWGKAADRWLLGNRRIVLAVWAILAVAGLALSPRLAFDFHPLHLKDPKVESMAAILDLMKDPIRSPYAIEIVVPDSAAADALKEKLSKLREVHAVISASSFVPKDQDAKLPILEDLQLLMGVTLEPVATKPVPSVEEIRASLSRCAARLREALPSSDKAQQLARLLDQAAGADPSLYPELQRMLVDGLMPRMKMLASALQAEPVTLETLPDEIKSQWIAADGEMRLTVMPKGDSNDSAVLANFVTAVRGVAPEATGPAVQIYESGRAVTKAFQMASLTAIVAIAILLFVILRRPRDVVYVMLPLLMTGLGTIVVCVAFGLKLDFANIIALPLLLGIGVAFDIYFVVNWRRGTDKPLSTSTARAVLFSALTTGSSFGSLALSSHPGTARMGMLLLISLAMLLVVIFAFMPVLMGKPPKAAE
ncbi:MMPL family transporter [Dongia sp.]|uniref:MMPL family transporter n=1 Tax=Dongia sp. TaxID=1977262 RepID=UPI0035B4D072